MTARVASIILAAGRSRRMGARNKLLLPISGLPMIRRMVLQYRAVSDGAVLVVTGHDAKNIEKAVAGTGAQTVFNREYAQGQQTSVACGLRAIEDAGATLIGLGDQPLLTTADLRALLEAHARADRNRISIPTDGEHRGNPILVPAALRARLLADPKGPGCKRFTRTHLEHVQNLRLKASGFYTDVDTPESYAAIAETDRGVTA